MIYYKCELCNYETYFKGDFDDHKLDHLWEAFLSVKGKSIRSENKPVGKHPSLSVFEPQK